MKFICKGKCRRERLTRVASAFERSEAMFGPAGMEGFLPLGVQEVGQIHGIGRLVVPRSHFPGDFHALGLRVHFDLPLHERLGIGGLICPMGIFFELDPTASIPAYAKESLGVQERRVERKEEQNKGYCSMKRWCFYDAHLFLMRNA